MFLSSVWHPILGALTGHHIGRDWLASSHDPLHHLARRRAGTVCLVPVRNKIDASNRAFEALRLAAYAASHASRDGMVWRVAHAGDDAILPDEARG